ncbi:MAG: hypothetical protein L3J88_05365 [Gammaproteobacteria bacterium]|nr:hypothetical protein [Gammaproteobacteria bacterium]
MKKAPFLQAEVDIIDIPGKSQIIFEAQAQTSSQVTEITKIAEVFVSAANFGMFSMDPAAATKTIEIDLVEYPREGLIRYVWNISGIQVGAYRVLLNMLKVANELSGLIQYTRLISTYESGKRLSKEDIQNISFPSKAKTQPFALQYNGNLAGNREPVIRLTFERNISDEELSMLFPIFVSWDNLVVRGGYLEKFADIDAELDVEAVALAPQQTYLATQCTVEHLLYEFVGHEAAFEAIINAAHRLHYVFCPLVSIEIE